MEIRNVKLDWNLILKNYIEYTESKYPDYPVRKSFEPIIQKLSSNQLRSERFFHMVHSRCRCSFAKNCGEP